VPSEERRIRIGHSPDPDDAFMYYAIAAGKVRAPGLRIEQVLEDIESLNRRAAAGDLEVTAVSIHAYAHLADRYALMPCGASMGDGYGPIVVTTKGRGDLDLLEAKIAVPGTRTSAFLALRLYLGADFSHEVVPFDAILDHVARGACDAGLVIHEGQLTFASLGLDRVVDLGAWWKATRNGLPLPLGGNAVRRDLGDATMRALTQLYRDSIEYALAHRDEALEYAERFGRGLDRARTDRFVGMYVNELTLDYGARGKRAIERFLEEGAAAGLLPRLPAVEFVS
jgi:1,4-dihydroxy-6-naphthoate synthase